MRKLLAMGVVAVFVSWFDGGEAQAQIAGPGWNYFGGWTYPFYVQERVPYFAAHPPVYYTQPIARSYGHSPFPYPSTLWPVPRTGVMTYPNPYAAGAPQVTAVAEPAAPKPLVIKNPFVQ